jgi:hypothetical protein
MIWSVYNEVVRSNVNYCKSWKNQMIKWYIIKIIIIINILKNIWKMW